MLKYGRCGSDVVIAVRWSTAPIVSILVFVAGHWLSRLLAYGHNWLFLFLRWFRIIGFGGVIGFGYIHSWLWFGIEWLFGGFRFGFRFRFVFDRNVCTTGSDETTVGSLAIARSRHWATNCLLQRRQLLLLLLLLLLMMASVGVDSSTSSSSVETTRFMMLMMKRRSATRRRLVVPFFPFHFHFVLLLAAETDVTAELGRYSTSTAATTLLLLLLTSVCL